MQQPPHLGDAKNALISAEGRTIPLGDPGKVSTPQTENAVLMRLTRLSSA